MSLEALAPFAKFFFRFFTSRKNRVVSRRQDTHTSATAIVTIKDSPGCQVTVILTPQVVGLSRCLDMLDIKCSKCQMPLPLDRDICRLP